MDPINGKVLGIAVKTRRKGPMREIEFADAEEGAGLLEDLAVSPKRGITLIDRLAWMATRAELGVQLPWTTRRANLLTEGVDLPALIGKTIRVGEIELEINGETEPCGLMDEIHMGLQQALKPNCRGGVYGRVVKGGRVRLGDPIALAEGSGDGRDEFK